MPKLGQISDSGPCADADLTVRGVQNPTKSFSNKALSRVLDKGSQPAPARRGTRRTLIQMTQRLRGLLRKKGQSSEDAEDLAQDALLKLEIYRRDQTVRDPEAFLRRTAVNQAIDKTRRSRRSPLSTSPLDSFDLIDPAPSADESLAARRGLERLQAGLAAMNAKTRDIVLAQRLDGLTYAQIAEREGISQSAVEKRLARGMLFLQEWMEGW